MTWLTGTTTWANASADIAKLVCGEMADGNAVTCATGDKWVREVNTSLDTIRTPAAKDVSLGNHSNRTGYFSCRSFMTNGAGYQTACKVTSPYTTQPGSFTRWVTRITVNTSNTVSGNYSTANVGYRTWNVDTGSGFDNTTFTPNSAGSVTMANGLVISLTDPSGFLPTGTFFLRGFTSTYMYGIDYWPMLYRKSTTPTFSVAPPGTNATDYDVVEIHTNAQASSPWGSGLGDLFYGLGIKTATGLGANPLYTTSYSVALAKCRIWNSNTAGILSMDIGQSKTDINASTTYRYIGHRINNWNRPFQTSTSVLTTSAIQYWISVKSDHIILILNGDPGVSGKMSVSWIGAATPYDTTYDVLPVYFTWGLQDNTSGVPTGTWNNAWGFQYAYWGLRKRQDGSEGARDFQTKWMRAENVFEGTTGGGSPVSSTSPANDFFSFWAGKQSSDDSPATGYQLGTAYNSPYNDSQRDNYISPRSTKPNPIDNKWWMFGHAIADIGLYNAPTTVAGSVDHRMVRGTSNTKWFMLPGDGWANGDELTDSVTGNKYLLIAADYHGIGHRWNVSNGTGSGGIAILEQ